MRSWYCETCEHLSSEDECLCAGTCPREEEELYEARRRLEWQKEWFIDDIRTALATANKMMSRIDDDSEWKYAERSGILEATMYTMNCALRRLDEVIKSTHALEMGESEK